MERYSLAPQVGVAGPRIVPRPDAFPWYQRVIFVLAAIALGGLLGLAAMLQPSSRGYGTHQQLGLPPCSFKVLAGFRCPACGMTTSWAHLMRGRIWQSLQSNSGGTLLGVLALVSTPWLLASGMRGRWAPGCPPAPWLAALTLGTFIVTVTDWLGRILLLSGA